MRVLTAIIAIAVGILILLGYFLPQAAVVQVVLLDWAIVLAGTAALIGVFNLVAVHAEKIRRKEKNGVYSAILIIGLFASFLFGLVLKPQSDFMQFVVLEGVIIPVEASLMALLAVSLLYAAVRLLRRRADVMSVFFVLAASLIFLGSVTLPFGDIPLIGTLIRPWVSQILALGGARGILIGVALGALTTGLRVLFGVDRPYGGR
ncbi:MAG: hypothetical protein DCC59_04630 [Chloroflexi bacterium]|nr:hypothetical protein [Chloroflexi bacterium CFX1]MCK6567319.1 hypothetical protein [Anaerolineales bacterium]MCQ3953345.1 hypothetical protein [Chloroflexota bacterium]MDL1920106.1 hypothetical protein [Chloroflexi bacterium CFX5]NUQ59002.1 hypothetical protein [Anaerolineales bacterium]